MSANATENGKVGRKLCSEKQRIANINNSLKSTGPRTKGGRTRNP
jgi:hypothetical protein